MGASNTVLVSNDEQQGLFRVARKAFTDQEILKGEYDEVRAGPGNSDRWISDSLAQPQAA